MSEQRSVSPPPSRIGPTEPDDTMVICPVCTSQFRAIPLDVQRQLDVLMSLAGQRIDDEKTIATLLESLKEARQYVMLYSPSGRPFDFPKETIDHIDAAIARAEGRNDE